MLPLQSFVSKTSVVSAAWLNEVDNLRLFTQRTVAEITAGIVPTNILYTPGYVERIGGTVPNLHDIARTTAVAGSKMKLDRLFEASTFFLEDEGSIWSGKTQTFWGFSREFGATDGQAGGPCTTFFAFANNNNCPGDVVAVIGDAVARTASSVFGGNLIARNAAGIDGAKLVGLEIDVEPAAGTTITTSSVGLVLNIFSGNQNATAGLTGGVGTGTWANGFVTSHIRGAHYSVNAGDPTTANSFLNTTGGTFNTAAIVLGATASQGINFGGDAFGTAPYIYTNVGRDLLFNAGTSGNFSFSNPAGVQKIVLGTGASGTLNIGGTKVVQQRETGWTPMTGSADKVSVFDTSTVTLAQLAGRVMSIQGALTTHGLIGA